MDTARAISEESWDGGTPLVTAWCSDKYPYCSAAGHQDTGNGIR
jgi:hypothetical protein